MADPNDAFEAYLRALAERCASDPANQEVVVDFRRATRSGPVVCRVPDQASCPQSEDTVRPRQRGVSAASIDIILPVHDALEDVQACLASVRRTANGKLAHVWLVDDLSTSSETADWLACQQDGLVRTIRTPENLGFTGAVAFGLQHSTAELVVVLNSDTVVNDGWLAALVRPFEQSSGVALTGALSNAAAWQSLGRVTNSEGLFATNPMPPGADLREINHFLRIHGDGGFVELPIVHGFCFAMSRDAYDAVGGFDLAKFGRGYGETQDLCFRFRSAGYRVGVCTDVFVQHGRSRSYSKEDRSALSIRARDALYRKHGALNYLLAEVSCIDHRELTEIRASAAGWFAAQRLDIALFASDTPRPEEFSAIASRSYDRRRGLRGGHSLLALPRCGGTMIVELPWRELADPASASDGRLAKPTADHSVFTAHALAVAPGPHFEDFDPTIGVGRLKRAKVLAYYLPQFHPIAVNDREWGKGFTEWRQLPRSLPRFAGHVQPRIPRDLGQYRLDEGDLMRRQIEMAKAAGLFGFCFYHYWFDGQRVLETPMERLLADPTLDFPFCLMWANENWSRAWDGSESEVILRQSYSEADDNPFIDDIARHMKDSRYIRIEGRPLLFIYRAGHIPNAKARIEVWRQAFSVRHGLDPLIFNAQAFGDDDPRVFQLDGAIEFPPHKILARAPDVASELSMFDSDFTGKITDYEAVVAAAEIPVSNAEFPLIRTVLPSWDNDARRPGRSNIISSSTPKKFEVWLDEAIRYTEINPVYGERLVCINAWNEWAEGAYLEPDVHFGSAYLNAVSRVVHGVHRNIDSVSKVRMLLVGHDALAFGAQMLLCKIGTALSESFGVQVTFLILDNTDHGNDFTSCTKTMKSIGDVIFLDEIEEGNLTNFLQRAHFSCVITNTTLAGRVLPSLKKAGLSVLSLVHELPNLLKSYDLQEQAGAIARHADRVIFPAQLVRDGFEEFAGTIAHTAEVFPQGLYNTSVLDAPVGDNGLRAELGLGEKSRIVLGVGYGDLRKGIDRFVSVGLSVCAAHDDVVFLWVGAPAREAMHWFQPEISASGLGDRVRILGHRDEVERFFLAADAFYLSSREDPFPSVVLEALAAGLPVIGHKGCGGCDALIEKHGTLVPQSAPMTAAGALLTAIGKADTLAAHARRAEVERNYSFPDYVFGLIQRLMPDLPAVSAVIPNYNYEEYVGTRLQSVFDQTLPIREVVVLDDASLDGSVAQIESTAEAAGRNIALHVNAKNSSSPFLQWRKGVELARGEYVWIAEADDLADPSFAASLIDRMRAAGSILGFTDSRQIGETGAPTGDSYRPYVNQIEIGAFDVAFDMDGPEFLARFLAVKNVILNVSGVIFHRESLLEAFRTVGDDLYTYNVAGDWRLYTELCTRPGSCVSYLPDPLNTHRRHRVSVTHDLKSDKHLAEIADMHRLLLSRADVGDTVRRLQAEHLEMCRQHMETWHLQSGSVSKFSVVSE